MSLNQNQWECLNVIIYLNDLLFIIIHSLDVYTKYFRIPKWSEIIGEENNIVQNI